MKRSMVYDRDPLLVPSYGRTTDENKQDIHPEQPISKANIQNQNHPILLV